MAGIYWYDSLYPSTKPAMDPPGKTLCIWPTWTPEIKKGLSKYINYVQWRSGLKLWTRLQTLNYENETMWCCVEPWASLFTRHCSN